MTRSTSNPNRTIRNTVLVIASILAAGLGAFAIWKSLPEPVEQANVPEPSVPAVFVRKVESFTENLRLVEITDTAGIKFRHVNGARGRKLLPETMGSGCAFFDFDRDGDQDLLFVNSSPWPDDPDSATPTQALYENDGRGGFRDVTAQKGLALTFYGMGVAIGDHDGDGWDDIFITAVGPDHLLKNDEGQRFVEVTGEAGFSLSNPSSFEEGPHQWSSSAAFLDYNNDGWLDLFVCRYIKWSPAYDLQQNFQITGIGRAYGPPTKFEGTFCRLYRNERGRFTDVSREAGIEVRNPHTGVPVGKSLAVTVRDMDADGFVDIAVANDTVQNFLFYNQGDGTFKEMGIESGIAFDNAGNTRGAMGIDWAQVDASGTQAIVVGNFANEITALFMSEDPLAFGFTDDAEPAGIGNPSKKYMKFGVFFFDLDLDGRLDIFEANGHLENQIQTVQAEQTYEQPLQIFWNAGADGPRQFEELREQQIGPDIFRPMVGRGCAYADIDGDGDLDVAVCANNGRARLFRNDGGNQSGWIRLKLRGKPPNTNAFGARVEVRVDGKVQLAVVTSGRGYQSQSEQVLTFGLGKATEAERVRIWWPGQKKPQVLDSISAETYRVITQTRENP